MKILDIKLLKNMLIGGSQLLNINKNLVDSLNVFPVPDGDTGTNMFMTITSATNEIISLETDAVDELMKTYARGALKGARGNSGVILSQIIRGISDVFSEKQQITVKTFSAALIAATEVAYAAVQKPKEGTILTVIRYIAEQSKSIAIKSNSIENFLKDCIAKGEEILSKTPEMLPVLKQAGVVDAGGKGLLFVLQGFYNALCGIEMKGDELQDISTDLSQNSLQNTDANSLDFENNDAIINSIGEIKYGYCTEYFVINIKDTATEEDIIKLKNKLSNIGDSLICIGDLSLVKVHVHTNQPNRALMYALQLGELDKIKIENMREQNRQIKAKRAKKEKKPVGMMTICVGEGIKNIFKDLMVDEIIEGGQTMNPSVEQILEYVDRVNSDKVIIFPNNKNIILAAQQARDITDKELYIIPTINIAQGMRAALSFDPERSVEDNVERMNSVIGDVKFGQVTHAVRTTQMDGFDLKEGDIIGLDDKKIIAHGRDIQNVAVDLVDKIIGDFDSVISIYYGENITDDEATEVKNIIQEKYPDFEIFVYNGGQPHYFYQFSIE